MVFPQVLHIVLPPTELSQTYTLQKCLTSCKHAVNVASMSRDVTTRLLELVARGPVTYTEAAKELRTTITSLRVLVHRQVKLGTLRVARPDARIERTWS